MKIFCLDTETSSGIRDGRIVQIAIVDHDFREEWLINPQTYIHPGCTAVHGISSDMLRDKPSFIQSQALVELLKRLQDMQVLIAHHAQFDISILQNEGIEIQNYICTCKVARKILKKEGIKSFSLQSLKESLELESINQGDTLTGYAHSALYDTIVLFWLYKYLYLKIEMNYPGQDPHDIMYEITHSVQASRRLSFGKYSGKSLSEIAQTDLGYLRWLYQSEMSKPFIKRRKALLKGIEPYL